MNRHFAVLCLCCVIALFVPSRTVAVTIATVPVGSPGNAPDLATGSLYGAVPYNYRIGTYDVTNAQYAEFLNANDPTGADPLLLIPSLVDNLGPAGGINYNSGAASGSKYSVISGEGNHPVNYVNWYDAIRFANWLNNGQPVYTTEPTATNNATENGSYRLQRYLPTQYDDISITRNPGATVFLPSENEWYKAAYYNLATSSYFRYPTSSNTAPTAEAPPGGNNSANYGSSWAIRPTWARIRERRVPTARSTWAATFFNGTKR
jgi:formylglycine-generating enzyme